MENTGIKRYEDYTENCENHYRLPNTSTMENLSMKVTAGEGAVLKMGDKVLVTDPAGNIKADKEKSTEKIDGAIATIMGLDRAIRCGNDTGASVYDSRGLLFI